MPPRLPFRLPALAPNRLLSLRPYSTNLGSPSSNPLVSDKGKTTSEADAPKGPTQDPLPHVSEEARAIAGITGGVGPEIEQGTPVSEVIKRDAAGKKNAPGVLKDGPPGSKREYSTMTTASSEASPPPEIFEDLPAAVIPEGAKFPLPSMPLPPFSHVQKRYSPVLEQVTNLLMRDGKKSVAQTNITKILTILRTKKAPQYNPKTPIITSLTSSLESLPEDPLLFLQVAIDSLAPLLQIKAVKGSGGFREQIPVPLRLKVRRRRAIKWIIDAADKRKATLPLAQRVANEIHAVVEGRSTAWEKRAQVHRTATQSRANVKVNVSASIVLPKKEPEKPVAAGQ